MNWNHLLRAARKRKYLVLLVSLLGLAVLHPTVQGPYVGKGTLNLLFCLVLAAVIFAVSQQRRLFLVALALGIFAMGATWGDYFSGDPSSSVHRVFVFTRFAAQLVFLAFTTILILRDILQDTSVSADQLCGAMSAYLLMGVIWAVLYSMIEYNQPHSFSALATENPFEIRDGSGSKAFSTLVYYSFVTLTTLGYGDITPVAPVARTFSWLEAVLGQLYLAVLIGRLVGLHIARAGRK